MSMAPKPVPGRKQKQNAHAPAQASLLYLPCLRQQCPLGSVCNAVQRYPAVGRVVGSRSSAKFSRSVTVSSLGDICLLTCVLKSVHVLKQFCETQGTDGAAANRNVPLMAAASSAEPTSESTMLLGQGSNQTLVRSSF